MAIAPVPTLILLRLFERRATTAMQFVFMFALCAILTFRFDIVVDPEMHVPSLTSGVYELL